MAAGGNAGAVKIDPPAFTDDPCILFWAAPPSQLRYKVVMSSDVAASVAINHGLRLNIDTGKTDSVVQLRR